MTASTVLAQDIPKPDKRGNYASCYGPVSSKVQFGGALWRVTAKLPVREDASLKAKILFYLKAGDTIPAFIGMGGSDEVLRNTADSKGRPWMRVVLPAKYGEGNSGYVRAHSHYIRPALPPNAKDDTPEIGDDDAAESGEVAAPAGKGAIVQGSELAGAAGVTQLPATTPAGKIIDQVKINDEASESQHGLAGKDTECGDVNGRGVRWTDKSVKDGWFSYNVAVSPQVDLILTYNGDDDGRTFDVLVQDKRVATQTLNKIQPGKFFEVRYRLSPAITQGKSKVKVTLKALPGSACGGLFGLRTESVP